MGDGSFKTANKLVVGDKVATPCGESKIKLIVETLLTEPTRLVYIKTNYNNLIITPEHPIQDDGEWILPKDHLNANSFVTNPVNNEKVYSFALDEHHVMRVEGFPTICLAHNFDDPKVAHEYLGTDLILQDLAKFPTDDAGRVQLVSGNFLFNKTTGKVSLKCSSDRNIKGALNAFDSGLSLY